MSRRPKHILKDLGILTLGLIGWGVYFFAAVAGAVYAFNHWMVAKSSSYWHCTGLSHVTRNVACKPLWYQGQATHWGLVIALTVEVIITTFVALIIWNDDWSWR